MTLKHSIAFCIALQVFFCLLFPQEALADQRADQARTMEWVEAAINLALLAPTKAADCKRSTLPWRCPAWIYKDPCRVVILAGQHSWDIYDPRGCLSS